MTVDCRCGKRRAEGNDVFEIPVALYVCRRKPASPSWNALSILVQIIASVGLLKIEIQPNHSGSAVELHAKYGACIL